MGDLRKFGDGRPEVVVVEADGLHQPVQQRDREPDDTDDQQWAAEDKPKEEHGPARPPDAR